jgi:tRNA pseudouridine38-40 synthase
VATINLSIMIFYKVIISYNGTNFCGWQFQTENSNSVQEALEKVLKAIVNYKEIKIITASRTDGGVHAKGQVLKIGLPRDISPENLKQGINSKLPSTISIMDIDYCNDDFNPTADSVSKEYHYYFSEDNPIATLNDVIHFSKETLDLEKMKEACKYFIGTHDFTNFHIPGSRKPSPIRTIFECEIIKANFSPLCEDVYYLKIVGNGFLKYMVRKIMDYVFRVGTGEFNARDTLSYLNVEKPIVLAKAKPCGLHLIHIKYSI